MKHVVVCGTFDGVHEGHIYLFEQAKKLGDTLTVVIARDETVKNVKRKKPKYNEEQRKNMVIQQSFVDAAVLGNLNDPYKIIVELHPDIIAIGYDQKGFADNLKQEMIKRNQDVQIVRLDSYKPEIFKSSIINN